MSTFYKSLSFPEAIAFHRRKQQFKKGKPCAICGKTFPSDKMMVAHIIPVRELSDYDALYDTSNWQVRCIMCEHSMNHVENLRKGQLKKAVMEREGFVPSYETDIYIDYDGLINQLWEKVTKGLKPGKKYRASVYEAKMSSAINKADKMTLAKAAAKYVMTNNGKMPTQDEIYEMLRTDLGAKMLFETKGNILKEKV